MSPKFVLATDGVDFEAEDLAAGETIAWARFLGSPASQPSKDGY
jgi:hypothetical protein